MRWSALALTAILAAGVALTGSAAAARTSIVVPPFRNATGEARIDWIGEGFSRTLVEKLNRIADLTSVHLRARPEFSPDGRVDLAGFLRLPGVPSADVALFGAVVKGGDVDVLDSPLEVTVRLVDLRTTEQVAAIELVGRMRELFSVEADLAARVAGLLGVTLAPGEEEALRTHETRSLQAYKETVLGTVYLEDGAFDAAIGMLEEAMRHHPGLFYPKAHHELARAYLLSGRKEQMLARFRKDAAQLSEVYFNLAEAQELNGEPGEAEKNYGLFLRYTDRRTLNWRLLDPGLSVVSAGPGGVVLEDPGGVRRVLDWETGREISVGGSPARPPGAGDDDRALVPPAERERITAGPLVEAGRLFYGLDNGYLVGRSTEGGERTWAYRLRGVPVGRIAAADGYLAVADDRGWLYSLGLHEGAQPSDLAAYLRLAELALRRDERESAEEIYRHIVEDVKFNVPPAWHALWELAEGRGDTVAAARRWERYRESSY